jgi:hypothetical protein|tara:strand:- start:86 stop:856 length:771 start_codon:yes stop_codon:yes gene_type:complete
MINIREYVTDLNVSNGDTKRMNCPNCNGYKTFTVTNNMGRLVWNCYKVTCSISGNSKVRLTVDDIKGTFKKTREDETFVLPEYVVPHRYRREVMQFCELWDLDVDTLDLYYDVKDKRVVFPVCDRGTILDAVGRSITKRLPKWKRYGNSDLPFTFGCGKVAVVVEDCVSASVIGSDEYVGVAVLGTSLSEAHKKYMTRFSTAIIALDPDALPKTLSFAKELRGYVNDVRVIKLNDDLKYRDKNDIINLMNLTPKEI